MRRAFSSACTAAAIVALTMAGCTANETDQSDSARQRQDTSAENTTSQGRELTDAEQILVQRAEELLVKKCMEGEGFKYWVGPLPTVDDLKGGGYVLTNADWAKEHGYGSRLEEQVQVAQRNDPNHAYANGLSQKDRVRYSTALEGGPSSGMLTAELPRGGAIQTPRDSCRVDAKDQLYGDFEAWFQVEKTATNLTALYAPDLVKDERFVNAVKDWSACMREAGHDYGDPPQIRERLPELTKGLSTEKAYAAEVELAVAEATCAVQTPLAATARALQTEYRDNKLKQYSEDIAAYQRMRLAALARAEDITGSTA
ncbi:hypothetical protein [Streptomyces himalayensis]|uniref:Lipoprotein n=1 Tax=Streptomyces himalayensis subsp. himalayensis TaxID=2756131 RepID=A0A7W0I9B1_9ACTN|nr:hypothetical protein [Streptomyces himalayensis]MBA2947073.1 hypothetical protein [Streptomyces himalayensis subsp. himalayensis]